MLHTSSYRPARIRLPRSPKRSECAACEVITRREANRKACGESQRPTRESDPAGRVAIDDDVIAPPAKLNALQRHGLPFRRQHRRVGLDETLLRDAQPAEAI